VVRQPLSVRPAIVAAGATALGFAALTVTALAHYQGSTAVFLLFCLSYALLAALIVPAPRLYAYTFFAALLLLGFWLKTVVHVVWEPGFSDPTGDFHNVPEEWDAALLAAACAAAGAALARAAQLLLARRGEGPPTAAPETPVPEYYIRYRKLAWWLTAFVVLALHLLNLRFAFFQVGVNLKLLLPWHLHTLAGWLVNIGLALWISSLAWWEYRWEPARLSAVLWAPIVEGLLAAASGLSRLAYLLHAGPYWLALLERWAEFRCHLVRRSLIRLAGAFAACFAAITVAVFVLRVLIHYEYAQSVPAGDSVARQTRITIVRQLPQLLVNRWCGLEGVLTVGAVPGRGLELLRAAVTEDPRSGADALYQRYAKPWFLAEKPDKFTFLANAGAVAILWFSGSLMVVLAGMALVTATMMLTEQLALRLTGNPYLLAVAGAALANVVAQTTFPYLTAVFLAQLWVAILFLGALQRLSPGRPAAERGP